MLRATFSEGRGLKIHQWDGQQRRRRWQVDGTYQTPDGEQTFKVQTKGACWMAELSGLIEQAIREDAAKTGWVKGIKWTAIGR